MHKAELGALPKVLKIFFDLLYHQFAWTYDLVAWIVSIGQWKDWVAAALPFLDGGHVLELGHGPGHLQLAAQRKGLNIFGLDLSPQMGRICRKRLLRQGFSPALIRGNGMLLPFVSNSFTTVTATFPTEYILLPKTLAQIHRVLAPGGRFVLVPLAWVTGTGLLYRFAAWLFRVTGQSVPADHPALAEGFERLKAAGFEVEAQTIEMQHSRVLLVLATKPG